jgi:hypothetical protein
VPKPFKGAIDLDIRDSTPDWDAFLPDKRWRPPRTSPSSPTTTPAAHPGPRTAVESRCRRCGVHGRQDREVIFDVADDAYVHVERELAAVLARD